MNQLSIYIHVPFCERKCGYCDFYSFRPREAETLDRYVEAVLKEMALYREQIKNSTIQTVFFGGGTPSLLGTERLLALLEPLKPHLKKGAEVTMEGNPESVLTLDAKRLIGGGVNRFSMGVQSGSDRLLKVMGRIHNVREAKKAFHHLREGGAENINLDLISSVPTESDEDVEKSVALIRDLAPEHVSVYSLIIEPNTPFYARYGREGMSEEEDRRHIHRYRRALEELGYCQYELSNFERGGRRCEHNLNYWRLGNYLGFGPAASGHLDGTRYRNAEGFDQYLMLLNEGKRPVADCERLSDRDRDNEYMMLGIRLNDGIDLAGIMPSGAKFQDLFGEAMERNRERDLVSIKDGRLRLTKKGQDLSNRVEVDFFLLDD